MRVRFLANMKGGAGEVGRRLLGLFARAHRALPTRDAVLAQLTGGATYEEAAYRLGIRPGLAYLIGTGVPADSTDGLSPEELARPWLLSAPQPLVSPPVHAPDRGPHIRGFIRDRLVMEEGGRP